MGSRSVVVYDFDATLVFFLSFFGGIAVLLTILYYLERGLDDAPQADAGKVEIDESKVYASAAAYDSSST